MKYLTYICFCKYFNTNYTMNTDKITTTENAPIKSKKNKSIIPPFAQKFPSHVLDIALLINNNAEIRRFTAIGILNYLLQKGEIKGDKRYVIFKWNKFAVKANGLTREYSFNEPFFLNALVASFTSFAASAQRTIDQFARKEMNSDLTTVVDKNCIEEIVALNESNSSEQSIEE